VAATTAVVGRWYHIAGTFDGAIETMYVNGVFSASTNFGVAAQSVATQSTIGSLAAGSTLFRGYLAHVAEWNRVLTAEEIRLLFTFPDALQPRYGPAASIHSPPTGGSTPFVSPIAYGGNVPFPAGNPKLLPPVGAF
jgi:hypothetical protein